MLSPAVVTRLCPCLPFFFFCIHKCIWLPVTLLSLPEVLIQVGKKNYACSLGVYSHIEIMWQKGDNDVGVAVPEGINVFLIGTERLQGMFEA